MSEVKKVVLAYSDGLDTSIIIPWLKEHYNNCEVIAVCGNVGQKGELEGLEERAKASGASKLYIEDLTDEFVEDYVIPTMQTGVVTRVICWAPALPAPFGKTRGGDCPRRGCGCGLPRQHRQGQRSGAL